MKKRASILLALVIGFIGIILALPEAPEMKPSRLALKLPEEFGDWRGRPEEPGEREKAILAKDTEFERMQYFDAYGDSPAVEVSIVFSGKNVSQSIHQPEVCLRAQGWQFAEERYFELPDVLPRGELLPVKEILCRRVMQRRDAENNLEDVILKNGKKAYIWRAFYYTFFGHESIVAGHYQRTMEDMKDRLFKGYDQRWAYATFSSFITKKHNDQGIHDPRIEVLDEKQTKAHITQFLKELLPIVIAEPRQGVDSSLAEGGNSGP